MITFNATSNIVTEIIRPDDIFVTLGIDSGISPIIEVRPQWKFASTLCYHFLAKKNTPEYIGINLPFLPKMGDHYKFDEHEFIGQVVCGAKIGKKEPLANNPDYDYWRVDFEYEMLSPEPTEPENPENPEDPNEDPMPEPADNDPILDISRSSRIIQVPAWYDFTGKAVVSSAGQQFNPPVMVEVLIESWHITRREYRNPNTRIDEFKHCVNSSKFWNMYEPWQVLVENINPKENRINNSRARNWEVTYTLSINKLKYGWKTAVLDRGTVQKFFTGFPSDDPLSDAPLTEVIMNEDSPTPITSPVMLDGEGRKLNMKAAGWKPVFEWNNGSPFEFRYEKNLNTLKIPNPYK